MAGAFQGGRGRLRTDAGRPMAPFWPISRMRASFSSQSQKLKSDTGVFKNRYTCFENKAEKQKGRTSGRLRENSSRRVTSTRQGVASCELASHQAPSTASSRVRFSPTRMPSSPFTSPASPPLAFSSPPQASLQKLSQKYACEPMYALCKKCPQSCLQKNPSCHACHPGSPSHLLPKGSLSAALMRTDRDARPPLKPPSLHKPGAGPHMDSHVAGNLTGVTRGQKGWETAWAPQLQVDLCTASEGDTGGPSRGNGKAVMPLY